MTIRELEILVAALESDVIQQKESDKRDEPAFKAWLEDSEKLLKKVRLRLSTEKSRKAMIDHYTDR